MATINGEVMVALGEIENPLEIHSVLDIIATHLQYGTLKNARNVCSRWNVAMRQEFRKRTWLRLTRMARPRDMYNKIHDEPSMERFVETFSFPPSINTVSTSTTNNTSGMSSTTLTIITTTAFAPLELEALKVDIPIHLDNPLIQNWMPLYGKHIKHLSIRGDHWILDERIKMSTKTFQSIFFVWCPNLKTLNVSPDIVHHHLLSSPEIIEPTVELDILRVSACDVMDYMQMEYILRELFKMIKRLKILRLWKRTASKDEIGVSTLFVGPQVEGIMQNLTTLDFEECKVDPKMLGMMSAMKFEGLRRVSIGPLSSYCVESGEFVLKFIEAYSPQLEFLSLGPNFNYNIGNDIVHLEIEFAFDRLKTLEVSIDRWNLGPIKLLQKVPNLVTLRLTKTEKSDISYEKISSTRFEDGINSEDTENILDGHSQQLLTELKLPSTLLYASGLQKMVDFFPHVKIMSVKIHVGSIETALCALARMTNLQKLELVVLNESLLILSLTDRICTSSDLIHCKMKNYEVFKIKMKLRYEKEDGQKCTTIEYDNAVNGFLYLSARVQRFLRNRHNVEIYEEFYNLLRKN